MWGRPEQPRSWGLVGEEGARVAQEGLWGETTKWGPWDTRQSQAEAAEARGCEPSGRQDVLVPCLGSTAQSQQRPQATGGVLGLSLTAPAPAHPRSEALHSPPAPRQVNDSPAPPRAADAQGRARPQAISTVGKAGAAPHRPVGRVTRQRFGA